LKSLQYIYLSNNQITDVGLKALAAAAGELKSLKGIFLENTEVTQQTVDLVKKQYKIMF
jgi:hypothetical protein